MKLTDIAKKPKLIKVEVSDEETLKEYGEAIEFYMWDRQPISTFLKMSSINEKDFSSIVAIVQEIVLDEKGKQTLDGNTALDSTLLMKIVTIAVDSLGN